MKYKKSMIIIMLAIFLVSIAAVSASDVNETAIASGDDGQIELSQSGEVETDNLQTGEEQIVTQTDNDENLSASDELDVLSADEATYSNLSDEISGGGNVELLHDYYRCSGGESTITIFGDDRIIDGKGAVIDMAGSTIQAFYVAGSGITIKNLTIKNVDYDGYGGAIYFTKSGTVENCNFTNNKASGDGGAIRMYSGTVTNCNFTDNNATNGGAVYFWSKGEVTNCNFIGNNATNGGALNMLSGSVTNSNFINNVANSIKHGGGAIYFYKNSEGNVTNCSFTNNSAAKNGGAIYFDEDSKGRTINCNFTNNHASKDGGAIWIYSGSVENCNFTDNNATNGGAVYFSSSGSVINCNFTNNFGFIGGAISIDSGGVINCNFSGNKATFYGGAVCFITNCEVTYCNFINNSGEYGGAVYFLKNGEVTNCNFTNNSASYGGAIRFQRGGTVENCNFTDNNATTGSAIYFWSTSDNKTVSNSRFLNNRANAETLEVTKNDNNITISFTGNDNLLNAIYSEVDVTFTNVAYWGANGIANTGSSPTTPTRSNKEAGQNITVSIVVNDVIVLNKVITTDENGMIVLDISAGANYYISARHETDSYYTEAETINSTMKFNVNVTSQTTNNKTVNITAKSNIPNEIIDGKLLFIVPNSDPINATYAGNGTWWAVYTFDNAGDYNVNASYIGLDNVSINNATISIRFDACVDVNNKTLDLLIDDTFTIVATTTPEGLKVNYVPDDSGVYSIDENGVVTALRDGDGSILIKVGGDGIYAENSTIVNVTISKIPTNISVNTVSLDLFVGNEAIIVATLTPADAGNVTFKSSDENLVLVEDDGNVIANGKGQAIITVSFAGNDKYAAVNKTVNVTVRLNNASVTVDKDKLDLKIGETYKINATKHPDTILLDITYKSSDKSVATVDKNGIVTAVGVGTAIITVSVGDDEIYAENSTNITVTVKKATPKITAKAKTFKDTDKNKKYTITLKDNKGKAIKNTKVYLKVNGKTYTAKTNSKGQATFKITKLTKKGTYTATITYKGNKNYNKITKKAKITVKQTWKTISKGSKNHAMVKKIQKALKKNGYYITYNGHYLKIDGIYHDCTHRSVKEFQHDKGLKVTGKVDYNTAKKLKII